MLLCTNDEAAQAPVDNGQGSGECPDGEHFVRWEWDGQTFAPEAGAEGTTMTATAFKDGEPSEPVEAEWTAAEYNVTGVVVGAGGDTCTRPGDSGPFPHSGTVETCGGSAGGGNGPSDNGPPNQSSAPGPDTSIVGPLVLLMLVGVLTFNIRRQSG